MQPFGEHIDDHKEHEKNQRLQDQTNLPRIHMRHLRKLFLFLMLADTYRGRLFMAVASMVFASVINGVAPIDQPQEYYIMTACGGLQFWAIVFMLHSAATCLLLVSKRSHRETFLINTFGVFVWGFSTISMNVSVGRLDPSACLELLTLLLSAWVLFRTESNPLTVK